MEIMESVIVKKPRRKTQISLVIELANNVKQARKDLNRSNQHELSMQWGTRDSQYTSKKARSDNTCSDFPS